MNPLHQSWRADEATARQRQVSEAQEYAARVHALRHPSPEVKHAAQRVRDTLRAARLVRDLDRYAKEPQK